MQNKKTVYVITIITVLLGYLALIGQAQARGAGAAAASAAAARSASTTATTNSAVVIAAGSAALLASSNSTATEYKTNDPLVVTCDKEQVRKAKAWQGLCEEATTMSNSYCPILSYQRYCTPANRQDVEGLEPVKSHYENVFKEAE